MLSDEDADGCEYALDVWLFLAADHWQLEHGGQISYIARAEDEEVPFNDSNDKKKNIMNTEIVFCQLLTICPSNNCLALVYRDSETMRFVKHINSLR